MSDWDDFEDEGPSKSELKRQVRALQDLGDELVALPPAELDLSPVPGLMMLECYANELNELDLSPIDNENIDISCDPRVRRIG